MVRRVALVLALVTALWLPSEIRAQSGPVWMWSFQERGSSGCIEWIANWNDGSKTSVPWTCDGVTTVRLGARTLIRVFPQRAANGCTEWVAAWSDGSFTWVPIACPAGVVYLKPGASETGEFPLPVIPADTSDRIKLSVTGGRRGGPATAAVETAPGIRCTIDVVNPDGTPYRGPGTEPKETDDDGEAAWSWLVDPATRPGIGTVTVICESERATRPLTIT